jgi:mono/diheme cytochrome c family protein
MQKKKMLNPEYGGDGKKTGNGDTLNQPIMGFPGHWAPNDLLFYTGHQFPERYRNGVFIAFHGSTIRAPYPQAGYFVAFVPFKNGEPTGEWEVFADGFAGVDTIINTSDAMYRPMALAVGPDGSLYVGESEKGKIWRIMYRGDRNNFKDAQLAKNEEHKKLPHIKTPDEISDNCSSCHQMNGEGDGNRFPPLVQSEWVNGDKNKLIDVVLNGLEGPINIRGKAYNNTMPSHSFLSDQDIALVLTYVRKTFNNNSDSVTAQQVKNVRNKKSK